MKKGWGMKLKYIISDLVVIAVNAGFIAGTIYLIVELLS